MDLKDIKAIIDLMRKNSLSEFELERQDFKIKLKRATSGPVASDEAPAPQVYAALPPPIAAGASAPVAAQSHAAPPSSLLEIKSPMIGTFYRSSAPGKPVFVEPGDEIAPGKVVCIIEAMKLFNEIESEVKGRIVKVLVEDASPVEYDQPLFLVEPA